MKRRANACVSTFAGKMSGSALLKRACDFRLIASSSSRHFDMMCPRDHLARAHHAGGTVNASSARHSRRAMTKKSHYALAELKAGDGLAPDAVVEHAPAAIIAGSTCRDHQRKQVLAAGVAGQRARSLAPVR